MSDMEYDIEEDLPKGKPGRPVQQTISMCKYRRHGVECSKWRRSCVTCGWNPAVEKEREWLMSLGHAPYLKIDPKKFKGMEQNHYRAFQREGDDDGEC